MRSRRVLLADDEEDIRLVAGMALEAVGQHEVLLADSGEACVALAERERPDVILLDVMMPGMDGLETLARLKASPATRAIPVVFMTARVQPHEMQAYQDEGARGIIVKPFDPMTLSEELERLIDEREG